MENKPREEKPDEKFLCPRRNERGNPGVFKLLEKDEWRKEADGSRTCSYCGSLHEDDFIQILEEYVKGTEGYSFDPSTKSYKSYAHRPNVANASQGGIKFYHMHVNPQHPDIEKRRQTYADARIKFDEELRKRYRK